MNILITSILDLKKSQHNRPHQIVKYLSMNHNITYLSINDWWKGNQGNMESYSADFHDVFDRINYIHKTERKISPILQEILPSQKMKDVLKEDFDVHINYNTLLSGYSASKKIPTIYDLADDLGAMIRASPQIPRPFRNLGGYFGDMMIKKNIAKSTKVSVTTDNLITTYNIPLHKAAIIPNGVDTKYFKKMDDTKEEVGIDGFVVGYVGVLREWVDFKTIFLALSTLDADIKMLIVGKEGDLPGVIKLAKDYGITDRVVFTGMVPYSQVSKYISAMDVCLIPFLINDISKNSLPLKLFEYMACEKPIISTRIPGVMNLVGDAIMYADNAEEYRTKIMELYEHKNLRIQMSKVGRQYVENNYEWQVVVNKFETLLKDIVEIN